MYKADLHLNVNLHCVHNSSNKQYQYQYQYLRSKHSQTIVAADALYFSLYFKETSFAQIEHAPRILIESINRNRNDQCMTDTVCCCVYTFITPQLSCLVSKFWLLC